MHTNKGYLSLHQIQCRYDDNIVVENLSLTIERGELLCLLGYSGCGKTTVLRAIAGFEPLHHGSILLDDCLLSSPSIMVPVEQRNLGMVFQDYALFPHLTVAQNITFSHRKESRAELNRISDELLEVIGMEDYGKRYPHELSGGQQQRVALARALAQKPEVILLDEPFSNLDIDLRERLALEVRDILKARGITAVMVTHDQHEAFAVADTVAVMHQGITQQIDSAYNLYHKPVNRFVAGFIGKGAMLRGTVMDPFSVETELGPFQGEDGRNLDSGQSVEVLVRPDDIVYHPQGAHQATVIRNHFLGAESLYTLQLTSGEEILGLFPSHVHRPVGEQVRFNVEMEGLIVFE